MKKIIFLALCFIATAANAFEIKEYNFLRLFAARGVVLHIAVDFSQCTVTSATSPTATSSVAMFTPSSLQIADDNIATSFKHFTLDDPAYPGKAVYEFVRYTFTADNSLALTSQTLDATNYALLGDPVKLTCKLGSGVRVFG